MEKHTKINVSKLIEKYEEKETRISLLLNFLVENINQIRRFYPISSILDTISSLR